MTKHGARARARARLDGIRSGIQARKCEYTLPTAWASAIINADESGLEEGEAEEIAAFLKAENIECLNEVEESGFAWSNDANSRGGDVAIYRGMWNKRKY